MCVCSLSVYIGFCLNSSHLIPSLDPALYQLYTRYDTHTHTHRSDVIITRAQSRKVSEFVQAKGDLTGGVGGFLGRVSSVNKQRESVCVCVCVSAVRDVTECV